MISEVRRRQPGLPPLVRPRPVQEADGVPMSDFAVSPSLHHAPGLLPAYEVKFLLTEAQARRVESELRSLLIPDPQGPAGAYSTTTVYCDTAEFDTYHRRGGFARRKFRLRRYGLDDTVFLERKAKQGVRVRKRRSGIPLGELDRLAQPLDEACWDGDWFHRRVTTRQLSPVLAVMYDRTAFVGQSDGGPLRLTFDRSVRGLPVADWNVAPFCNGHAILSDRVICEFKFRSAMPAAFKGAIESQQLSPGSASKYRLCLEAAGAILKAGTVHA